MSALCSSPTACLEWVEQHCFFPTSKSFLPSTSACPHKPCIAPTRYWWYLAMPCVEGSADYVLVQHSMCTCSLLDLMRIRFDAHRSAMCHHSKPQCCRCAQQCWCMLALLGIAYMSFHRACLLDSSGYTGWCTSRLSGSSVLVIAGRRRAEW